MEEFKLSDDVIEQIKDFDYWDLTNEQKLLVDKLILNEELKKRFKGYGLCKECKQPNTGGDWCKSCNVTHFQQNFQNWSSKNNEVDKFIQKKQLKAKRYEEILEWIEYDRFENVEYLAEGGFGTIHKAIWKDGYIVKWNSENNQWKREENWLQHKNFPVVLKCLHNSVTSKFLREIESHTMVISSWVTRCFGITKGPDSNKFMMVIEYAKEGSLRQYLNNIFNLINWEEKLEILQKIAGGLDSIHEKGLIHRDFHSGNMLKGDGYTIITDLGLCQPANVKPEYEKQVLYGVLPYVAPEVLRGKEYTQESDIYAFGIIAYEVCTGLPPFYDFAHDKFLAISICEGHRPKANYKIPQLILDIIKQCWDADPLKRPKACELYKSLYKLYYSSDQEIHEQIKEAERINEKFTSTSLPYNGTTLSYTTNPQAIYTSRLLSFENLPEPKNDYSVSIEPIDFTKLNLGTNLH
ncbi:kinase-like domain-containing protein [Rhizophagus irregularis DAOM 181602=DAOM 197198]|uniref:Kinase-like domain-containing protein n=1 Tax=Rhizophagus irregularis (strain DAOM 181602 / DAOM 197198 / MUCL 43194) TaxID=747089 RepID=A0A2P4Q2W4_RHIID|nr:kinase-like domain-containing protein [Rhizophagus irregularis DAOM 181602=DAOM 197198]POG71932.1 kinase-like domain-containing protein [Rhizophagus irregularis DAOM 181602=DAOM 197198]|eukprot:XP_025178798.1 kinase-like domain-containing protein [Rhizophagus irregularis DAOM 181602=DAOM 197198]